MSKKTENTGFGCVNCGMSIVPLTNGSFRNHCPFCLYSLHVDNQIGDRASSCLGKMKPLKVINHSRKGFQIVHKCEKCGLEKNNKIAEDTDMPDSIDLIIELMKNHS